MESATSGQPRRIGKSVNENDEDKVVDLATENSTTNIHLISRHFGVPKSTVRRILQIQLYLYYVQGNQAVLPTEYEKRYQFCKEILRRNIEDLQFSRQISKF